MGFHWDASSRLLWPPWRSRPKRIGTEISMEAKNMWNVWAILNFVSTLLKITAVVHSKRKMVVHLVHTFFRRVTTQEGMIDRIDRWIMPAAGIWALSKGEVDRQISKYIEFLATIMFEWKWVPKDPSCFLDKGHLSLEAMILEATAMILKDWLQTWI